MKLILKEEFKECKIVKCLLNVGLVIFDTNKVKESEYITYYNLGFDFCFEPAEPLYKAPIAYKGVPQEIGVKAYITATEITPQADLVIPKVKKKKNGKKNNEA